MFSVTPDTLRMLYGSHEMSTRISVFAGSTGKGDIPFVDGSVSASLGSQVARTASFTVDRNVFDQNILSPLRDQVIIFTGVKGVAEIPLFTGRIDSTVDNETGNVSIQCVDHGADVIGADFEVPWVTGPRQTRYEVQAIITTIDPSFVVDVSTAPTDMVPTLVFEQDPGSSLDTLATSINSIWMSDRTGGFTLFPNPYYSPNSVPSVLLLQDGVNGSIVSLSHTASRESISNSVTIVVERSDGSTPIRVTVRDDGTNSPTKWGGLFGKKNLIIKNQSIQSEGAALIMANRVLRQSLSLARSWSISTPHLPVLDPGDVITVKYRNEVTQQVVESVRYPLLALQSSTLATRELKQKVNTDVGIG